MSMRYNNFAAFILSHGRPDKIYTYNVIRKLGYTGKIYIVLDNLDKTIDAYKEIYDEDEILIFDKEKIAKTVDNGDNFENYRSTTHARNAIFDFARKLGIKYFIQLDDDYTTFKYSKNHNYDYVKKEHKIKELDRAFDNLLDFYTSTNIDCICMSQGGDFIGGDQSMVFQKPLRRKAMNSFICSTDRPFKFFSRLNEDVNTYLTLGVTGRLFVTFAAYRLEQKPTQSNSGGMTDAYNASGTYVKSFYSVMYNPSFVKVSMMGNSKATERLHHQVKYKNAVPLILDEKYKK